MAVKTITIDVEAYEILARNKKPGQSFSQVIKSHFGSARTVADFKRTIEQGLGLSEDTLQAVEHQIKARRASKARAPRL